MKFGIVFKSRWDENPLSVHRLANTDAYRQGERVDPTSVDAAWNKDRVTQVRDLVVVSTETEHSRKAYVVSRP